MQIVSMPNQIIQPQLFIHKFLIPSSFPHPFSSFRGTMTWPKLWFVIHLKWNFNKQPILDCDPILMVHPWFYRRKTTSTNSSEACSTNPFHIEFIQIINQMTERLLLFFGFDIIANFSVVLLTTTRWNSTKTSGRSLTQHNALNAAHHNDLL